jgi:NAD(P)-dependent dehydrogenase (short-subunit alcohol dehydrogenase family)
MRTNDTLPAAARLHQSSLDGRVVLITGAAGGIGKALSLACARAGATVVMHGSVVLKLEAIYYDIIEDKMPDPTILPLDLARAEASDFANVANALDEQLGRLDALVHTAALLGSLGPLEHQSFDNWVALLRVNVAAPMGLTRIVMPLLTRSPDASVVFTLDSRGQEPRA